MSDVAFLLWSLKHDAWWRVSDFGYTNDLADAERYTEAQAVERVVRSALCGDRTKVTLMVAAPENWAPIEDRPARVEDAQPGDADAATSAAGAPPAHGAPATLVLERKDQPNETPQIGRLMLTPMIDEEYWLFRVRLTQTQAIVGFPKFTTIGIGFAVEEDWNTNLPFRCSAEEIYEHIKHNAGDESITRERCIEAIEMVRRAASEHLSQPLAKDGAP